MDLIHITKISDIPSEHETDADRIKYLHKLIKQGYREENAAGKTKTVTACMEGQYFNVLKLVTKTKGEKWKEHLEDNFPYITERTIQRYMSLANCIDLKKHKSLGYIGMTNISSLRTIVGKKKSIAKYLKGKGIDLKVDPKSAKDIGEFRSKIEKLIKTENEKRGDQPKFILDRVLRSDKDFNDKVDRLVTDKSTLDDTKKKMLKKTIKNMKAGISKLEKLVK